MQSLLLRLLFFTSFGYLIHAAILKSAMINNYPQVAVLGCDSQKANLYYDTERRVWVEHLVSSCVNSEQSILEFCQQAYPTLRVSNIIRLDTVLRFENWCELMSPIDENGNNIERCKQSTGNEEVVQPFRCLYMDAKREELRVPARDCSVNSIVGAGECLRAEKWQQLASLDCANRSMLLNNSLMTLDWCGLAAFRGIEFVCCPLKDVESKQTNDNDYETSLDEQDNKLAEDDPIRELDAIPFAAPAPPSEELRRLEPSPQKSIVVDVTTAATHRRILAMSLGSREPNWMEDYRRWNTDSAYFADDEDTTDYQDDKSLASKYQSAMNEHERFTKDKEDFKRKYKEQIESLKSRWQSRQGELQLLANRDASEAQNQFEQNEREFRQEYDLLKQTASRDRTRINELHEVHLDTAINAAKSEAKTLLTAAWDEKPIKTETLQQALYNYLHVLLCDRIHLVNRYERLRAIDSEQAKRKQPAIYERLRLIAERINDTISQLQRNPKLQKKIQLRLDVLFSEYDEVNQAADRLLIEFVAVSSTSSPPRLAPLGRDEKKIYPFSKKITSTTAATNKLDDDNAEYDYATNDEYEDDDDDDNVADETKKSTTAPTGEGDAINYDQVETNDSEWDVDDDADGTFNVKTEPINDEQNPQVFVNENDIRPLMPDNNVRRGARTLFVVYLPYAFGFLMIICLLIGALVFRCMMQRRAYRHGGKYEKNYVFTEVESCTPEEKALHALQINGYENPTYKFFETQTPKC